MVDIFLKVVDRLISLLKERERNRRESFFDIVEPLYIAMLPVVDDYFKIFWELRDITYSWDIGPETVAPVRSKLINRREKMYVERSRVISLAKALRQGSKDEEIKMFAEEVINFFSAFEHTKDVTSATHFIDMLSKNPFGFNATMNFFEMSKWAINKMSKSWMRINEIYGVLKIEALGMSLLKSTGF